MQLRKMNAHYENVYTEKGAAIRLTSYASEVVWFYPELKTIELGKDYDYSVTTCKQVITFLREVCNVAISSINDLRRVLNGKANNLDGFKVCMA